MEDDGIGDGAQRTSLACWLCKTSEQHSAARRGLSIPNGNSNDFGVTDKPSRQHCQLQKEALEKLKSVQTCHLHMQAKRSLVVEVTLSFGCTGIFTVADLLRVSIVRE